MTWTVNLSGHHTDPGVEGGWNAETEKEIADMVRPIIETLKTRGLSYAMFNGNYYQENFLAPKKEVIE